MSPMICVAEPELDPFREARGGFLKRFGSGSGPDTGVLNGQILPNGTGLTILVHFPFILKPTKSHICSQNEKEPQPLY
jgi:hypothetical protein